ncbi:MAG: tetratricopeptide repeat protein [Bacteriovoracaceae bacterium]|nr:tetratricopeptide repeat protein [Bacteriovoracaceae bacterium]
MKSTIQLIVGLLFFCSCATKHLTSKVSDPLTDSFREESFLRYTEDRLKTLENTPYQALAKCHGGDTTEGLNQLQKKMKENKKDPEYWNQVGMCYFLNEDYTKAEYFYELSLSQVKKRSFAPALNNLGVLKLKLRHYEDALNYFKNAASASGAHKVPLFNQAQVYLQFNLLDQAAPILEDLSKTSKNDPDLLFSLGSVYLLKGQMKRALHTYNQIPDSYKNREDVTLVRAISLYEQGLYYEAKEALEAKNFIDYVPLKRSAQKLTKLLEEKIKAIEAKEAANNKKG